MTKWTYSRMHIPGGCICASQDREVAECHSEPLSKTGFLEQLNKWNRMGMGHWQYWTDDI